MTWLFLSGADAICGGMLRVFRLYEREPKELGNPPGA